jgi:DNA-binding transcriptional MerR regulator
MESGAPGLRMSDNPAGGFKAGDLPGSRRPGKSASAFRTISEVATDLDVPQHVLRFWETRFTQIRPLKRAGGRRYYRPEDVELLRRIRELLYNSGYTIKGVQRLLRDAGRRPEGEAEAEAEPDTEGPLNVAAELPEESVAAPSPPRKPTAVDAAIGELLAIKDLLRRAKR